MSVLLLGHTTKTLTKQREKKFARYCTIMLHVVLNKSLKQHPTKTAVIRLFTSHLFNYPRKVSKTCLGTAEGDMLLWTSSNGDTNVDWLAKPYIHLFNVDTDCCLEDFSRAMTGRDTERERERESERERSPRRWHGLMRIMITKAPNDYKMCIYLW